jgi:hypothetical protein
MCIVLLAGMAFQASAAAAPYETYTYSISGEILTSPHAYTPIDSIDSYDMNLATPLNAPKDIFVDENGNGNIYIADTKNNRVLCFSPNWVLQYEVSAFVNEHGVQDSLKEPQGIFVFEDILYVCDTLNARVVLFNKADGSFDSIVGAPNADIMGSDTVFRPVAVGVNKSGTMYIVSDQTYSGIIALNPDGSFQAFLGAQKTSVSLAVRIRRMIFPTITTESYISTPYKNLTMDSEGQIWATIVFGADDLIRTVGRDHSLVAYAKAAFQKIGTQLALPRHGLKYQPHGRVAHPRRLGENVNDHLAAHAEDHDVGGVKLLAAV